MSSKGAKGALNRICPGCGNAKLGDRLAALVALVNELRSSLLNGLFSNPGLAIGVGSKAKVLIANTVQYRIAGVPYSKATAELAFTATTHDIAPHATLVQECVFLVVIDSGGTLAFVKGTIATGAGNAVIPATPANKVALGYARIAIAGGVTPFDASSDDLDAGHITDTYVNFATDQVVIGSALEELT